MKPFDFILLAFATLYAAHVLTTNEGPFHAFRWIRDHTRRLLGGLFDCFFCLVVWAAFLFYVISLYYPPIVWVFAIAGAAIAIRSYTGLRHD